MVQFSQTVEELSLKRIIVPLDGSAEAELSLPYSLQIATWFDSEINLLHVIGNLRVVDTNPPSVRYPDLYHDRGVQLASAYLGEIAKKLRVHCPKVRWRVATGLPAEMVAAGSVVNQAGLIVIKYRSKSLTERISESIFDHIWRVTPVPILAISSRKNNKSKDSITTSPKRIIAYVTSVDVLECIMPYLKILISLTSADVDIIYPLKNVGLLNFRGTRPPIHSTELDDALIEIEKAGSRASVIFTPNALKTALAIQKLLPNSWNITASRMRSRVSRTFTKSPAYDLVWHSRVPTLVIPFKQISNQRTALIDDPAQSRSPTKTNFP